MHFQTSLIILVGFALVVYIGLVKVIWELSQFSFHESPVIREVPGKFAAVEDAKEVESYESSPTEFETAKRKANRGSVQVNFLWTQNVDSLH
jgi:hypothetical protein